jgi:Uma2 family endonuclease
MNEPAGKLNFTPEQYLAWEREQPEKHEYLDGEVFAMAGASRRHNLLVANVITRLTLQLANGRCEAYPSDLRVHIPSTGLYTYPDVSVVCEQPEFLDETSDTLLNPRVLVEVLSSSTEDYDRGKKFMLYRSISSLQDYLLIASDRVYIDHYAHQADGSWVLREAHAGGRVALSIGCTLEVDELYLKVFAGHPSR